VGREGIEPPQPKAADLQSAELTTLLNLPAMGALNPILPGRSPFRAISSRREVRGCMTSSGDDRLSPIHEDGQAPCVVGLHLESERGPAAGLDGRAIDRGMLSTTCAGGAPFITRQY
jgi:hypothetical protein